MFVVSVFTGIDRNLIGPFTEREAEKLANRLRRRADQLNASVSIMVLPITSHTSNLETILGYKEN